ncbi:serine/threonine-protein kinase [Iningainema tapete]|uniref:Serine/threonine protein kinase n=1 Tax=Iningainema tapete BLCC-T55 TaxID=2748662 RepID=A0A8J6XHB3_9CYAN|nr:serine/threonine-protein kinase [Iningainema tapete]MBD2770571.1 serine/threonine protein kinase [Iningainema tapete BLCC-T55]
MIYCLNPSCEKPLNSDGGNFCQSCGIQLIPLLRNRYRITKPLGSGGFGRTFLAEDEDKLKEDCVVKQLAPQVQGTSALQKATQLFQEEARRLQQLGEHPQIPHLYAYFSHDNYLYLVQQFIQGQTLRQELKQQGNFSEEKIWELLNQLLPVLKFIHSHQVIHRDIKPENIIRRSPQSSTQGTGTNLVLIDFGVAKHLTVTSAEHTGTVIGSYGYAPVEQMKSGCAYPASDLFSLGVTCFYLLTGINPFHLYVDQGYNWVTHWRQYVNSISAQLEQVLDKLLQKDIEHRYQSADEVLRDLHELPQLVQNLQDTPIIQSPPAQNLQDTHVIKPPPAQNLQDTSITQPPLSRINLQSSVVSPSTFLQQTIRWKKQLLVGSVILLVGLSGYIYWRMGRNTLIGHGGEVNSLAFHSPLPPDPRGVGGFRYSEGKEQFLASGSDDKTVKIWNLNHRQEIRTLKGHLDKVYTVAIGQDGQTLVSGSSDHTIKVWNLNTGKEILTLKGHNGLVNSVAISPDGNTLVSGSYDKTVRVWNLKTGEELRILHGHQGAVLSVAISPDGEKIVSASTDRTIKVWNLKTGKEIRTQPGHLGDVNAIAISPNGQFLASASDDKHLKVWNLNTGKEIRTLSGHLADVNAIAWSPDGEKIATGSDDKTVRIWNLATGEELYNFKEHLGKVFAVTFSPDGKTLLSASEDKTIKIWQLQ